VEGRPVASRHPKDLLLGARRSTVRDGEHRAQQEGGDAAQDAALGLDGIIHAVPPDTATTGSTDSHAAAALIDRLMRRTMAAFARTVHGVRSGGTLVREPERPRR